MASPSKRKGNRAERELANKMGGTRAWGSDGRSMGESKEVDVIVDGMRLQVKSRKKLPQWLEIAEGVDAVAIRIDRDGWYLLQRLDDALKRSRQASINDFWEELYYPEERGEGE